MSGDQHTVYVEIEEARVVTNKALRKLGWDEGDAALQADVMISAELCGNNQGLVKMLDPSQMKPAKGAGKPTLERETLTSAVVNGNQCPGMLVAVTAADIAIGKLRKGNGPISIVSTFNTSTSSGQLAFYANRIAQQNFLAIVAANSPELVTMSKGGRAILGTNPICFGVPRAGAPPLTFDMATAAMAFFGVLTAKAQGTRLPDGVAFDRTGKLTTDADAVLDGGALATFGDHKGAGLALMVEILAGALSGAAVPGQCESKLAANSDGHLFIAIDPCGFVDGFEDRVASLLGAVQQSGVARLPGQRAAAMAAERRASGSLPIPIKVWHSIKKTANSSRVLVLGSGVSGLTCALQLLRGGHSVEVWRKARGMAPPNWVWEYPPYHTEPQDKARAWAKTSLDVFTKLAEDPDSNVYIIPLFNLGKEKLPENPGKAFLPHFKEGREALEEARKLIWSDGLPAITYVDANCYHAPVCNSVKYLSWLQRQIEELGGMIHARSVESVEEAVAAAGEGSVVVNCTGMGARDIVPDTSVYPSRGELLHVDAPWVRAAVFDDVNEGYVIPCPGCDLELGGTADDHAYERKLDPATAERILRRNIAMLPSLSSATTGDGWVGLRPQREAGIRLELEWCQSAFSHQQKSAVVHNYGHGGAGMALSYGCADEVVRLVEEAIYSQSLKSNL